MTTDNLIAGSQSAIGIKTLQSINPATRNKLPEKFPIATEAEINTAVEEAYEAWKIYKNTSGKEKAIFLRTIADEIENLSAVLTERAMAESGLPEGRINGERGRTCNQLRMFANLVEEGSWVDAIIDKPESDGRPNQIDIRKMSISLGPVAVFTASNFPLAFSTAGGDTASALAAGCSVIVKAHPSHLGTNTLVAKAISTAIKKCNLPKGIFSSLNGEISVGQQLVQHPKVKAVGFTGSNRGGKALFDLANNRPVPIPVYAEMGSNNPIFILPKKLKTESQNLATTIANSVNLGAGQFCTNPGILILEKDEATTSFLQSLKTEFSNLPSSTMLNEGIFKAYQNIKSSCVNSNGVKLEFEAEVKNEEWVGQPSFATVAAKDFLQNIKLQEEVFGPFTLLVLCNDKNEIMAVAQNLQGQLTCTVMGTEDELSKAVGLVEVITKKAGRVIFNGVPTGVAVCNAMHHGGSFPSTTNPQHTSVGTDAIKRFIRPVAFQNAPEFLLPQELRNENPLNIWRTINGKKVKA